MAPKTETSHICVDLIRYVYHQGNMQTGTPSPWNVTIAVDDKVEHYPLRTDGSRIDKLSFTYTRDEPGGCGGKVQVMQAAVTIEPVPPNPLDADASKSQGFIYPCPGSGIEVVSLVLFSTNGERTASWDFWFSIKLTCTR